MPSHLIHSRPREAEAGVLRKLGLEIAGKTNPSKFYRIARGVVCVAILARTNSEGSMNPAIVLVDVASTNREGLKSFLQKQKCHVDTAADGVSAVRCCLWDLLGRILTLLQLKKYMDEQAKAAAFALARSVDSKQNLRNGHLERLVAYAEQLGESLGLGDDDLHELRIASWLHDIGKIDVPESILLKPGPLDAEERRIMQEHPIIGEKICAPLKSLRRILPVIRHHHEKMDGSGYPDGLRGEAMPLKARILQIADIYDALTTNRPYPGALPPAEA